MSTVYHSLKPSLWLKIGLAAAVLSSASLQAKPSKKSVEHGKYLVENVGMCSDCHSPRLPDGSFDMTQWLMGSPLPFVPTIEMPWTPVAPPIAGLPTLNHDQAVEFLMTGNHPSGRPLNPPMPHFRFSKADAKAVTDYLKSLGKDS